MLQVNLYGPADVRLEEAEAPRCGDHDAVIEVACCGICGTDVGYVATGGVFGPTRAAMPLGHEICGRVIEAGARALGVRPGQRVAVNPMAGGNLIGNGGSEGGFTNRLLVRSARLGDTLHLLPDSLSDEMGALVEPLSVAMHGINVGAAAANDAVVVMGAGPIGLATIAVLRHRGVDDIVAVDLSDERLARARRMGARAALNAGDDDFFEAVGNLHGAANLYGEPVLGTNLFVDATGAGPALAEIVRTAGPGARVVVVGLHKHDVAVSFRNVMVRELRILGAIGYPVEFPEVIEMLSEGRIDVSSMISHRYPLEEFAQALGVARDPHQGAKVMVTIGASA